MGFTEIGVKLVIVAALVVVGDGAADTYDNTVHTGNSGSGHRYAGASSGAGAGFGAYPPLPMFPQFDYSRLFNEYFQQLQNYHQQLAEYATRQSFGPGTAGATYGYGFGNGGGAGGQEHRFPGAAAASAGVNYDGTAYKHHVYPNADTPNVRVENRFADASPPGAQSYGVFVSSAGGSGVGRDGKPFRFKTATSAINDNGNITTYTVKEP